MGYGLPGNEGNEPPHIHAEKGEMECKYWLIVEDESIEEAFSFNLSPKDKREVSYIIYRHFDELVTSWYNYFERKK